MRVRLSAPVLVAICALMPGCYLSHERVVRVDGGVDAFVPEDGFVPADAPPLPDSGCDPADALGCREMLPANVEDRLPWSAGRAPVALGPEDRRVEVSSDDGSIVVSEGPSRRTIRTPGEGDIGGITFRQLPPIASGGSPLGVLAMSALEVPVGVELRVRGSRALVILVGGVARIDGTVSASASSAGPGPGGFAGGGPESDARGPGAAAEASDTGDAIDDGGGGGGSFGGPGGQGGGVAGGAAGVVYGDADLSPLVGGSGGGGGGLPGGNGGHGGGAIQISARERLVLGAFARVEAHGSGGAGGGAPPMFMSGGGGGGGGAGGAVLLEAPIVELLGRVAANGGAGGSGAAGVEMPGVRGADGSTDVVPVLGAPASGRGGAGGSGSAPIGAARDGGDAQEGGGGGGGGGRVRVQTLDGVADLGRVSPDRSSGLASAGPIEVR